MFSDAFDREKSERTKTARGIDFIEARAIWLDPEARQVEARLVNDEVRYATIGLIEKKLWVAIWTPISPDDLIRIISVHRAEKTKFERMYHDQED